jgi:hypothetical protein
MSLFGPALNPIPDAAEGNTGAAIAKIVVNTAAQAIQEAISPTPDQVARKEAAQREAQVQRDKEARENRENADRARLEAMKLEQAVSVDEGAATTSKAEVLSKLGRVDRDDGIGFDAQTLELSAQRERTLAALAELDRGREAKTVIGIPGLDGMVPEVTLPALGGARVMRLDHQESTPSDADRGPSVRELEAGVKSVRVKATFADGTSANFEMKFRPAEERERSDVAGRLDFSDNRDTVTGRRVAA